MFIGLFKDIEDVKKEFDITDLDLERCFILFAGYEIESYSGEGVVLFERDGKLYIVVGGHCSCYGLEGQWDPVETCEAVLRKEIEAKKHYAYDSYKPFVDFCNNHFRWGIQTVDKANNNTNS